MCRHGITCLGVAYALSGSGQKIMGKKALDEGLRRDFWGLSRFEGSD